MPEQLGGRTGRKRKQSPSSSQGVSTLSAALPYQQSTITDHFSPRSESPQVQPQQSPTKRPKRDSMEPRKGVTKPVNEVAMRDLGDHSNPIDLTSSPAMSSVPRSPATWADPSSNQPPISFKSPLNPKSGPKKLQVYRLKNRSTNDGETFFTNAWNTLDSVLTAIFKGEPIDVSLEELYRSVEHICRADRAPQLFNKLMLRCEDYVLTHLQAKIVEEVGEDAIEAAKIIETAWTTWSKQLKLIRSIFLYLDRSYLFSSTSQQSIEALGMELFKRHVVTNKNLISRLLDGIFALLAQDRQNNDEDVAKSNVLSSCVRMISSLGIYATKFDPQFIAVSRAHYAKLAQSKPKIHDLRAYLMYVADQVQKEAKRCDRFHLEQYTKREVVAVVEHEMVRQKKMLLADNKLVGHVLKSSDFVSLQILYRLLERVALVGEILKPAWAAYINDEGLKIINDEQLTNDMIPRLLDFKNGLESIWSGPWNVNKPLGYVLRESFSAFINEGSDGNGSRGGARTAEMLAKYLDILLRQGVRGLPSNVGDTRDNKSEDSIDDDAMLSRRLESVLDLFRFIHRKDVFEAFYKKDLAKRLLTGRSASVDTEWLMLTKLKTECGSAFTNHLEAMFRDIDLSRESVVSFKTSKAGIEWSRRVDLHVNILSRAAWPSYSEVPVNLPPNLARQLEAFGEYYVSTHQGRKLSWLHSMSRCTLKAEFPKGNKELSTSTFQAVVLLAFNDVGLHGMLSYSDLLVSSGLPADELKRSLQSLACGKTRVLVKIPKGKDVCESHKFQINQAFVDKKFRVKINQIQPKETKAEVEDTHERIERDRKFETQAAIIRIMKSRRVIKHVELVQQTIEQTKNRGALDVTEIKQNIERLIEKEYMERDGVDTYVYLA